MLNALMGTKLAIVSEKPQTTRTLIQAVLSVPGAQVVFLDTPGIHRPDSLFNQRMMDAVRTALDERDVLLYLADATAEWSDADAESLALIGRPAAPVLLALNKVDRVKDKAKLLPVIEQFKAHFDFADYIPISALKGEGLDMLRQAIVSRCPEGPEYFPQDHITDQPERYMAAELIREKILRETHAEVPHAIAVSVERWEETPTVTRIAAAIYVEREGQKGIVIGSKGSMLKKIGTLARIEMERMLGRKVFLELFVKLRPHWRENPQFLDDLDWRSAFGRDTKA